MSAFPVTTGLLEAFSFGAGFQDQLFPANPGAGNNLTVVVGSNNWVRVLAAVATITTDANAANRVVSLDFITPRGITYLRNSNPTATIASQTNISFQWSEQLTQSEGGTNTPFKIPVSSIFLPPATTIGITLDNKQVGDTIAAVTITIERFDTGPTGYPIGYAPNAPELIAEARAEPDLPDRLPTGTPLPGAVPG